MSFFNRTTSQSIGDIDGWIERLIIFKHAVKNPQDFMHADAYDGHVVFSLFSVFFIYFPNQWIMLNGR